MAGQYTHGIAADAEKHCMSKADQPAKPKRKV